MRAGTAAFFLGILLSQQFSVLPGYGWMLLLLPAPLVWRWRRVRPLVWFGVGFFWACFRADLVLSERLPGTLEGRDVWLEGVVTGLPVAAPGRLRFELGAVHPDTPGDSRGWSPRRIRLNWYQDHPRLVPGERWRLKVRLRQPRGSRNPGAFDAEGYWFRNRVSALGYVRSDAGNRRLGQGVAGVDAWRYRLRERLDSALAESSLRGLVAALAVGARDGIQPSQWEVLAATGTNHLMAISGLHIGLVAGFGFVVVRFLWARWPLGVQWCPAPRVGMAGGLLAACAYSALAGFALPTQRAVVMLAVVACAIWLGRNARLSHSLTVALALVLAWDPLAAAAPSLWLSFGAVALIAYASTGRGGTGGWRFAGRLQWMMAVGLLPLTVFLFQRVSVVAPLANAIAIPCVGFVIVPVTLAAALLTPVMPGLAGWLLGFDAVLLEWLWRGLVFLGSLPVAEYRTPGAPLWSVPLALVGVALLLGPRGLPGRWLGLLWLTPLLFPMADIPPVGTARLTLLDVGQGLSAVVRTARHVLVFDTGPRWGEDGDAARSVLLPFLRGSGIGKVDLLILSHGDSDHTGGFDSLHRGIEVAAVRVGGDADPGPRPGRRCRDGDSWEWDGVRFEVLHPPAAGGFRDNSGSCVVRVGTAAARLLLTGDIEADAERRLLRDHRDSLPATVLVAPHHGSETSSVPGFVATVNPRLVLFASGYRNRFKLPRPRVVARYRSIGATTLTTAASGAIVVELPAEGEPVPAPVRFRERERRYWHLD